MTDKTKLFTKSAFKIACHCPMQANDSFQVKRVDGASVSSVFATAEKVKATKTTNVSYPFLWQN